MFPFSWGNFPESHGHDTSLTAKQNCSTEKTMEQQ
jgi:hypothetical protein